MLWGSANWLKQRVICCEGKLVSDPFLKQHMLLHPHNCTVSRTCTYINITSHSSFPLSPTLASVHSNSFSLLYLLLNTKHVFRGSCEIQRSVERHLDSTRHLWSWKRCVQGGCGLVWITSHTTSQLKQIVIMFVHKVVCQRKNPSRVLPKQLTVSRPMRHYV